MFVTLETTLRKFSAKTKKMKVLFLTAGPDIAASSRARVYQILPYLNKENIQTKVIPFASKLQAGKMINNIKQNLLDRISRKIYYLFKLLKVVSLSPKFDVIFIQKIIFPAQIFNLIKMLNDNIIFDFDDAIFLSNKYQDRQDIRPAKRFNYILRNCKSVIVGNSFLKERAITLNEKVYILTSPVDVNRFSPNLRKGGVNNNIVIGWIGSPDSSSYLRNLKEVFESLLDKHKNLKFKFIGADDFFKETDRLTIKKWDFFREADDLRTLDIGIMPLDDDEWCWGKGGYKLLQYMAMGIASVASPVGINCELIQDGINGFLARTPEEWKEKLDILVGNNDLRLKMGIKARESVESLYSYERTIPQIISILRSAL